MRPAGRRHHTRTHPHAPSRTHAVMSASSLPPTTHAHTHPTAHKRARAHARSTRFPSNKATHLPLCSPVDPSLCPPGGGSRSPLQHGPMLAINPSAIRLLSQFADAVVRVFRRRYNSANKREHYGGANILIIYIGGEWTAPSLRGAWMPQPPRQQQQRQQRRQ